MENVNVPPEVLRSFTEFRKNVQYVLANYQLLKEHVGEYVAIGNGRILDFSKKRSDLLKKYNDVEGLFVELITSSNMAWIL